jgi:hypothetical protein
MNITLEDIVDFFEHNREMHSEDRLEWNIDAPCRWSFYFVNSTREALVPLADYLEAEGYEIVAIEDNEDTNDYFLQVDKVVAFTPASLFEQNQVFDKLADKFNITRYDGMDVGENE